MSFALLALLALIPQQGEHPHPHPERFTTDRDSPVELRLPLEDDAFSFAIFGDRTGGPAEGVAVLADAVDEVNVLGPDLVMTVGDLIEGYNQTDAWLAQADEYLGIMNRLAMPWFPVAGNHDVYWRGPNRPEEEHEGRYEQTFGPLWYAFEHKGGGAVAERAVYRVRVACDPPAVSGAPEDIARLVVESMFMSHRCTQQVARSAV